MDFRVLPVQVTFEARDEICFPPGEETNVFRGALGLALRQVSCKKQCPGAGTCPEASTCAYARLFEPRWLDGPSGYRDAPRPFVLRWTGPSGGPVAAGTVFSAGLNLFETGGEFLKELTEAFRMVAAAGIGPDRGKAVFRSIEPHPTLRLPVEGPEASGQVTISFVTPTELKSGGSVSGEPEFSLLIERLAERVWTLGRLYQHWTTWDYGEFVRRSRMVRLMNWEWRREERRRRSSRTKQSHSLGGYTGSATFEGPIGEFLPLLEIGRWTGVGRQTVWGKGEIQVDCNLQRPTPAL